MSERGRERGCLLFSVLVCVCVAECVCISVCKCVTVPLRLKAGFCWSYPAVMCAAFLFCELEVQ